MELDFNKVGTIDKNMLDKINSSSIPEILKRKGIYHYTSINGIESILKDNKLWFTHVEYMNDKKEVAAGIEEFKKIGKRIYKDDYNKISDPMLTRMKRQNLQTFVCCFSLERDELSLWNYYTKDINNQGYNIGFDYKELVISILKNNQELHGSKLSFGKVDYCLGKTTYARQAYETAVQSMKNAFDTLICYLKGEKYKTPETKLDIPYIKYFGEEPVFRKSPSFDLVYFMKKPCFSKENEFRIVIQVSEESLKCLKKNEKYKFRKSNGILIPYLELDFNKSGVIGITFSPTTKSDLAMRSIEDYCFYCEINPKELKEGIRKSKIPVRF